MALSASAIALENFGGVICEVLVYDRPLNAGELDAMNFYLAGKYNLVITPIPPVLQVASVITGTVTLRWESVSGRRYQLQSATNLSAASWTNEGVSFNGTGGVLTCTISIGAEPTKFWCLRLLNN